MCPRRNLSPRWSETLLVKAFPSAKLQDLPLLMKLESIIQLLLWLLLKTLKYFFFFLIKSFFDSLIFFISKHAKLIQTTLSNKFFRIYTQDDVIGVEIAGALKNVFAIGAGMIDGYGFGFNTKTALISRGNIEIQTFAKHYGGKISTLQGLAGMGDLVLTCFGAGSRNRTFGFKLAQGINFLFLIFFFSFKIFQKF